MFVFAKIEHGDFDFRCFILF